MARREQGWLNCCPSGHARLRLLLGEILLAALCIAALAAAQALYVEGTSMVPTLYPGQLLLINKAAYWRLDGTLLEQVLPDNPAGSPRYLFGGPHRGDVVVFRSPASADYNVKRVIGLPGELLRVDAGRVFIDGQPLDEPYVQFPDDYSYPVDGRPGRVPDGAYFVLGDNRPVSADSHLGWFVPADNLLGQAVWPLPQDWLPHRRVPPPAPHPQGSPAAAKSGSVRPASAR